ncbi:hypothetical protein L2X99_09720 [Microbacterium sp. KUDC0406]|uniref:hypothetical protein n=1 Tax=Microbacterium sp. KUDC0406 TaxID=2909588 RepID=UPI001F41A0E7|nr:hypothetical protein [Microbacterium sp. KUDC0406]UJP08793.1 hypothetical protein L2X99_09720 [Microbacterium sp. KUDC0406]
MRNAIVRFAALYVFNVAVLLVLGLVLRSVHVGWNAFWAAIVLTAAALALKPALLKWFRSSAAKSSDERSRFGEKLVQYAIVFVVELIIWAATVLLSGVSVSGFFWGWIVPPIVLLIGWVIYDRFDDRLRAKAGQVYDATSSKVTGRPAAGSPAPAPESPATTAAREELSDGLTPEQRRMLDDL